MTSASNVGHAHIKKKGPAEAATSPSQEHINTQIGMEMNKHSNITAAADTASAHDIVALAAHEFEPWNDDTKLECLKSLLAEWDTMRSTLYLANACMYLPKAELIDGFAKEPEALLDLIDCLGGRPETLRRIADMAEAALGRLIVAGAGASLIDVEVRS